MELTTTDPKTAMDKVLEDTYSGNLQHWSDGELIDAYSLICGAKGLELMPVFAKLANNPEFGAFHPRTERVQEREDIAWMMSLQTLKFELVCQRGYTMDQINRVNE